LKENNSLAERQNCYSLGFPPAGDLLWGDNSHPGLIKIL